MADANKQKRKSKGGLRTKLLAVLLGVVALAAIWLSDCIPGFGLGSQGTDEGQASSAEVVEPAVPAEPESEVEPVEPAAARKPMPMKLTIDARGCLVNGGEPQDCEGLCEQDELFTKVDAVTIDAKQGPHGTVVKVLDCLKTKDLAVSITRR